MADYKVQDLLRAAREVHTRATTSVASHDLEERLLNEFLRGASSTQRARLRQALDAGALDIKRDANAPDTDEARTKWALINALLDLRTARLAAEREARKVRPDSSGRTRVQVVVVAALREPNADAMVYRRPDDNGVPVLVLRESSLTGAAIQRGVAIAARSVRTHGKRVTREQWVAVHRRPSSSNDGLPTSAGFAMMAEALPHNPVTNIPGIGEARSAFAWARIPQKSDWQRKSR